MRKLLGALLLLVTGTVNAATVIELHGAKTAGALMIGKTSPGSQVKLNDKTLTVSKNGVVVFGFERDAKGPQTLTVKLADGSVHEQVIALEPRNYKIDRVEGVPQRTVTPDPEQVARARKEAAAVWQARQTQTDDLYFLQPVISPAEGRISGV